MESDGTPPSMPVVLYDANVLYPFHLRNLLVQLAVNDIVEPRWTDLIHDEWIRNVAAAGIAGRDRLLRTRDIMKRVLPGADVTGYESRIEGLSLPDPDDRHVLAAAIAGRSGHHSHVQYQAFSCVGAGTVRYCLPGAGRVFVRTLRQRSGGRAGSGGCGADEPEPDRT
jgi:hypothetical protein